MGFPNVNLSKIRGHLSNAFDALGHDADFTIRDGTTFTLKVTEGFRQSQDLTDGMTQETHRLKVLADEWNAASPGRQPEKGDQVVFLGRRYAIQNRIRNRGLASDPLLYVLEVKG